MARCAFASLVDAIIFIDCARLNHRPALEHEKAAYLGDFLNISDRLEPQLDFAEGGHVAGILGGGTVTVRDGETGDGLPGEHGTRNV
jgi:hypothetical protein